MKRNLSLLARFYFTSSNHLLQTTTVLTMPPKRANESNGEAEPEKKLNKTSSDKSSFEFKTKSKEDKECNLKISTWNVAGLRAWIKKDGLDFLQHEKPDVICLQEIKCSKAKLPAEIKASSDYKHQYYFPAEKEGYAGVALISKVEPLKVDNGFGIDEAKEHDAEGRVITAEFDKFFCGNNICSQCWPEVGYPTQKNGMGPPAKKSHQGTRCQKTSHSLRRLKCGPQRN